MYFENVHFPRDYGVIYTEGFRLFVNGTLFLDAAYYSRIQNSGIDMNLYYASQYGTSGAPAGTVGGGADGGDAGVVGTNIFYALGGAGGAGNSKSGGSAIPPSTLQGGTKVANNISNAILGIVAGSGYHMFSGGAGGGGGNSYGGAGGGGVCLVVARNIESTAHGSCMSLSGSDWSGDGGSGGGGAVIVVTAKISGPGTFALTSSGGRNGSDGNTYLIEV